MATSITSGSSSLPPRRSRNISVRSLKSIPKSTVDVLKQMGFTQKRAEKAVTATGDRGVQLACDWLLSHVNDALLDADSPREYILYLCPVGALQEQLMDFWEKSRKQCGWNGAHSQFPHVTLCPMFKAADNQIEVLVGALEHLRERLSHPPGQLKLEFYNAQNFIGLFVKDEYYHFLESVISEFAQTVAKSGIQMESHKKQLHVTLAYQYPPEQHEQLLKWARDIDPTAKGRWDMRLYSRHNRISTSEVRKVVQSYEAAEDDELDLIEGDFVFTDLTSITASKDTWYSGMSWLTGCEGLYPGTFTERTAETWAWTLHSSVPIVSPDETNCMQVDPASNGVATETDIDALYAKVIKRRREIPPTLPPRRPADGHSDHAGPRELYVVRHGERVDFAMGRKWIEESFDADGTYICKDLNMPLHLPKRRNHYDYFKDSPLTEVGHFQAKKLGEGLYNAGVRLTAVYSSPSLRCIQTATEIITAMHEPSLQISVDFGIFEWLHWYHTGMPVWFTNDELIEIGYSINKGYEPAYSLEKLTKCLSETVEGYYNRCGNVTRYILKRTPTSGQSVLIVGHAGSLDVCTRQIVGKVPRNNNNFLDLVPKVPYCAISACHEDPKNKKWHMVEPPVPTMTHGFNKNSNYMKMLMS